MYNITATYEVTMEKEVSIDLDKIIEAVLNDVREDTEDIIFSIDCQFGDNIEYYLRKLGMIDDSVELSDWTVDYIYDEFWKRMSEVHPEFSRN